jgi:hypothetical protein
VSYAWSDTRNIDDVHVMDQWGSSERGYAYQKQVPSRIAYEPQLSWGYCTEPGSIAYCWTKLLLDRSSNRTQFDDECLDTVEGPGLMRLPDDKSAEEVVADYLTQLYTHIMGELDRKLSKDLVSVSPIRFWFTFPALWSIKAQTATKNAAERAGFSSRQGDSVHLVREPEAAAIACLQGLVKSGPSPLVQVWSFPLLLNLLFTNLASRLSLMPCRSATGSWSVTAEVEQL